MYRSTGACDLVIIGLYARYLAQLLVDYLTTFMFKTLLNGF